MAVIDLIQFTSAPWILIPLTYFLWVSAFLFLKRLGFNAIRRMAEKTKSPWDDIFIKSADFPLTLLIFTSGGVLIEPMIPKLPEGGLSKHLFVGFKAITIVAIVLFADLFLNNLIKEYTDKIEILRTSGGVARGFVRIIVIGLGILILLDSFGVSITPIIASLGIGSLAVALALQPTLENFFSGIQIVIDKPFQVGHFIKLESGEEGFVYKIGWRSSWIRMLPNTMVVIPNKTLVDSRVINYDYPSKDLAVLVDVGVHYNSDLDYVERVTLDVARQTMKEIRGGVKDFDPSIRYHTFSDSGINFTVILKAQEFIGSHLLKHEFIKRLQKRFRKEGIVIPYPIRAINYSQEKA